MEVIIVWLITIMSAKVHKQRYTIKKATLDSIDDLIKK